MQRIPEPEELMDDPEQALAYAGADFSDANTRFVALLEQYAGPALDGRALDLGCGPADIPLMLSERHPALQLDAVDGAEAMLEIARRRLQALPQLAGRVQLHRALLPCPELVAGRYAGVLSNSLLHHLPDPALMWHTVRRCAAPGAWVVVMDLARPDDAAGVDALVALHAADAPPVLARDFRNSLFAAYTVAEVREQLDAAGLAGFEARQVSDRHLAVFGRLD